MFNIGIAILDKRDGEAVRAVDYLHGLRCKVCSPCRIFSATAANIIALGGPGGDTGQGRSPEPAAVRHCCRCDSDEPVVAFE